MKILPTCLQSMGIVECHDGETYLSVCLGSKAYADAASERGGKAAHETKQTRSRGGCATDLGRPPSCGPGANCGPAGPRSKAHSRGVAALIESEPLLLMQRRCRTQHERSPSSTGTPDRRDNSTKSPASTGFAERLGHGPTHGSSLFLVGLSSAPAKASQDPASSGDDACLRRS